MQPLHIAAVVPVFLAIVLHELAHAWVARRLGDDTAHRLGRLTLNPLKHIEVIGTIIVPAVLYAACGVVFGWAKPVPIDFGKLRSRCDAVLVALAGPAANAAMSIAWGLLLLVDVDAVYQVALFGVQVNVALLLFNLIPLAPFDGGRVLAAMRGAQ